MGVDTSVSVGVGFLIPEDVFNRYRKTIDDHENYGDDEVLEMLSLGGSGLCFGTGGSYYDNKPMQHWVAVNRLTTSYNTYDIPGGVVGLDRPVITLAEREALGAAASALGIEGNPEVGQFMSVLWY